MTLNLNNVIRKYLIIGTVILFLFGFFFAGGGGVTKTQILYYISPLRSINAFIFTFFFNSLFKADMNS